MGKDIRVLLQKNLISENCLVNGSLCIVKHVYYKNDKDELPEFITCEVPGYIGTKLSEDGTVPFSYNEYTIICKHHNQKIKVT